MTGSSGNCICKAGFTGNKCQTGTHKLSRDDQTGMHKFSRDNQTGTHKLSRDENHAYVLLSSIFLLTLKGSE